MNNLEPRAKIGDVVIVRSYVIYSPRTKSYRPVKRRKEFSVYHTDYPFGLIIHYTEGHESFNNEDILKNLTTNTSYE